MDYDLYRLSSRSFEQMIQALAAKVITRGISLFGDGPDGGREASYTGRIAYPGEGEQWEGMTVLQVKFRQRPQGTREDTKWALGQLERELQRTFEEREPDLRPDNFIFATNVALSSVPGSGGKARAEEIASFFPLAGFDVWDYDRIRAYLDGYPSIRTTYAGYVFPGDILSELGRRMDAQAPDFDQIIANVLEKEMREDQFANLEQAGRAHEEKVPISRIFVDLPTDADGDNDHGEIIADLLEIASERLNPSSQRDRSQHRIGGSAGRFVLVGGPGQGKTTVGQFACQMFRASILRDRPPELLTPEAKEAIDLVVEQCEAEGLPIPAVRRFPIRIPLTELSASLASNDPPESLLEFIRKRLEKRASRDLSRAAFWDWLATYPWLLVLDGLDEVPASSNRDAVLKTITDFLIDATGVEADILVLATTRPQGYNDDFSPSSFRHVTLAPLPKERALHYGHRLARARYSEESRREKVIGHLERAVRSDATAKLMTTPLQVTIMATLVDKVGEPPRRRWKLFSEYYAVIYAREEERDGSASEILKDHKPDIDEIHRRVALLLQADDERMPESGAKMSRETFAVIVRKRLEGEGHEGSGLLELESQVIKAATDRLVFLVGLEADEVGFEIRSLQEFMAAEALMDGPDEYVVERLRAVAGVTSWRNVFLLAAGRCYDREQHFRDTINTVCAQLNDPEDDLLAPIVFPGSLLAVDLLADELARSQPAYSRLLAREALRLLHRLLERNKLGLIYQPSMESVFRAALERGLSDSDQRRGALSVLLTLSQRGISWAEDVLKRNVTEDRVGLLELMQVRATKNMSPWLVKFAEQTLEELTLADLKHYSLAFARLSGGRGGSLEVASAAFNPLLPLSVQFAPRDLPSTHVAFSLEVVSPAARSGASPRRLAGLVDEIPGSWPGLAALAQFERSPSAGQLASQLRGIGRNVPREEWAVLATIAPWPLAALLISSRGETRRLEQLVEMVKQGELGDYEDWEAAERRWRNDGIRLADIDTSSDQLAPFDRTISTRGFPLAVARGAETYEDVGTLRRTLLTWMEAAGDPEVRRHLARFILEAGARTQYQPGDRMPSAVRFARALVGRRGVQGQHPPLPPLTRLAWGKELSPDELELLDRVGLEHKSVNDWGVDLPYREADLAVRLGTSWTEGGRERPGLLRMLALLVPPMYRGTVPASLSPELKRDQPGAVGLLVLKQVWYDPDVLEDAVEMMIQVSAEEPVWLFHALEVVEHRRFEPAADRVLASIWEVSRSGRMGPAAAENLQRECERRGVRLINRRASQLSHPNVWSSLALFERPFVTAGADI